MLSALLLLYVWKLSQQNVGKTNQSFKTSYMYLSYINQLQLSFSPSAVSNSLTEQTHLCIAKSSAWYSSPCIFYISEGDSKLKSSLNNPGKVVSQPFKHQLQWHLFVESLNDLQAIFPHKDLIVFLLNFPNTWYIPQIKYSFCLSVSFPRMGVL